MVFNSILKTLTSLAFLILSEGFVFLMAEDTSTLAPSQDQAQDQAQDHGNKSVWEIHWPLFLGVLVFIAVSIMVVIICCLLLKVCKKRRFKQPEKIVADEPEFRLAYAGSQGQKPMGESLNTGDPLPIDEENGWIIPLDQMTPEELDQPEVPLSKV